MTHLTEHTKTMLRALADGKQVEYLDDTKHKQWWTASLDAVLYYCKHGVEETHLRVRPTPAQPSITDECGRPMTYWGGKAAPQPLTEDNKDALRYRWLFNDVDLAAIKDAYDNHKPPPGGFHSQVIEQIIGFYTTKADADSLIDAAIEADIKGETK